VQYSSLNSVSLAFIGDAVYSLYIRKYYVERGYRQGKVLQDLCKRYVSASGQSKAYHRLLAKDFFNEKELEVYKGGRNNIKHIPRNGDRVSYETASGLEAVCGYLYLFDNTRLEEMMALILEGGEENE